VNLGDLVKHTQRRRLLVGIVIEIELDDGGYAHVWWVTHRTRTTHRASRKWHEMDKLEIISENR